MPIFFRRPRRGTERTINGGGDKGAEMVARASICMWKDEKGEGGGLNKTVRHPPSAMSLEVVMVVGWIVRTGRGARGHRVKWFSKTRIHASH